MKDILASVICIYIFLLCAEEIRNIQGARRCRVHLSTIGIVSAILAFRVASSAIKGSSDIDAKSDGTSKGHNITLTQGCLEETAN